MFLQREEGIALFVIYVRNGLTITFTVSFPKIPESGWVAVKIYCWVEVGDAIGLLIVAELRPVAGVQL